MIPAHTYAGKSCAVFGLGLSGMSAVRSLQAGGAEVLAWDDAEAGRARAASAGAPLVDLASADWTKIDALVLSPGVPLTHPEPHWTVRLAAEAGVPVIGDTEILMREIAGRGAKLVAITGTNGKSTTTALIGHMLQSAGRRAEVGGNIGTAAVLDLTPPAPDLIYVIEFSSYQIDLTPGLKADVAVLLNISPDHLDRHGSMDGYARVKSRIFANQDAKDVAVIGMDDDHCRMIRSKLPPGGPRVVPISQSGTPEHGVGMVDGRLYDSAEGAARQIADLRPIGSLRGAHNGQNAAAAYATGRALGLNTADIEAAFHDFPGLAHRMEEVGRRGGVLFVNDSKGTNADATANALASFERIYWIAGGRPKSGGIEDLRRFFPRIAKAYLIGEAAEDFAATLKGAADAEICVTLERAVARAAADAAADRSGAEPVVLLSPACASFDQYRAFYVRGDAFRELVLGLEGITPSARAL